MSYGGAWMAREGVVIWACPDSLYLLPLPHALRGASQTAGLVNADTVPFNSGAEKTFDVGAQMCRRSSQQLVMGLGSQVSPDPAPRGGEILGEIANLDISQQVGKKEGYKKQAVVEWNCCGSCGTSLIPLSTGFVSCVLWPRRRCFDSEWYSEIMDPGPHSTRIKTKVLEWIT